jgi:NADH:ubiquinone oxidoreductase subunit E
MSTTSPCACANDAAPSEADLLSRLETVLSDYRDKPGGLIPALQLSQAIFGYLPETALRKIAQTFDKSYSEVAGVVSFYSFFSTVPRGKHLVRVCLGTACYVRGGGQVLDALKKRLGIDVGQTTEDRLFSLEVARCFGACGLAPTMSIDDVVYKRVRPSKVGEIIDGFYAREGAVATSASVEGGHAHAR